MALYLSSNQRASLTTMQGFALNQDKQSVARPNSGEAVLQHDEVCVLSFKTCTTTGLQEDLWFVFEQLLIQSAHTLMIYEVVKYKLASSIQDCNRWEGGRSK